MGRLLERRHRVGALATLYALWLATWFVSKAVDSSDRSAWDHAAAAAVTGLVALRASRRVPRPYPGFLVMQGCALLLMAASWVTYQMPSRRTAGWALPPPGSAELSVRMTDVFWAACAFAMLCAWGYLALERWHGRKLSVPTGLVFAALMAALGAIFVGFYYHRFYYHRYHQVLHTAAGRLDAVTAVFEFAVLVTGLLCLLLREPPRVVTMLVGTVILIAGDMAYAMDDVPVLIGAVSMLGQFLLLSAVIDMPHALGGPALPSGESSPDGAEPSGRSGLSGILILMSLGALLLSPLVWLLPVHEAWKPVFAVLSIVGLVTVLVWITDRFDDAVAYVREYVERVHRAQLVCPDWRGARPQIGVTLRSTGLDRFLDEFHASAARLKRDVLFLGPERLYAPPRDRGDPRQATCFLVMPFSEEWSSDVHRILAGACEAAGVRSVRGDDLFTPTDILEDLWQGINAADFVIADITGRNPNVLYELGIAHTLAKPVLILSQRAADIPIDLATRRVIVYGQRAEAWREELAHTLGEAIAKVVGDYGIPGRAR